MRFGSELLYSVFERNLFVPRNENEDIPNFVDQVICDYLRVLGQEGITIPPKMKGIFVSDLKEEVIEMTRKKIYGYTSILEFRTLNSEMIEQYYKENA